ncbi:hypothetical protein EJ08DRAFT_712425 [Tothia fuscella]|uniref:Uncharacterized protein n=1 Tax=Tothia fuscella TaxID=1048955 RepID=A0A9P4NTY2_9PEZI|nr:hypothetical protein EJ08DRAFT_712425 [Tothia fuscella]
MKLISFLLCLLAFFVSAASAVSPPKSCEVSILNSFLATIGKLFQISSLPAPADCGSLLPPHAIILPAAIGTPPLPPNATMPPSSCTNELAPPSSRTSPPSPKPGEEEPQINDFWWQPSMAPREGDAVIKMFSDTIGSFTFILRTPYSRWVRNSGELYGNLRWRHLLDPTAIAFENKCRFAILLSPFLAVNCAIYFMFGVNVPAFLIKASIKRIPELFNTARYIGQIIGKALENTWDRYTYIRRRYLRAKFYTYRFYLRTKCMYDVEKIRITRFHRKESLDEVVPAARESNGSANIQQTGSQQPSVRTNTSHGLQPSKGANTCHLQSAPDVQVVPPFIFGTSSPPTAPVERSWWNLPQSPKRARLAARLRSSENISMRDLDLAFSVAIGSIDEDDVVWDSDQPRPLPEVIPSSDSTPSIEVSAPTDVVVSSDTNAKSCVAFDLNGRSSSIECSALVASERNDSGEITEPKTSIQSSSLNENGSIFKPEVSADSSAPIYLSVPTKATPATKPILQSQQSEHFIPPVIVAPCDESPIVNCNSMEAWTSLTTAIMAYNELQILPKVTIKADVPTVPPPRARIDFSKMEKLPKKFDPYWTDDEFCDWMRLIQPLPSTLPVAKFVGRRYVGRIPGSVYEIWKGRKMALRKEWEKNQVPVPPVTTTTPSGNGASVSTLAASQSPNPPASNVDAVTASVLAAPQPMNPSAANASVSATTTQLFSHLSDLLAGNTQPVSNPAPQAAALPDPDAEMADAPPLPVAAPSFMALPPTTAPSLTTAFQPQASFIATKNVASHDIAGEIDMGDTTAAGPSISTFAGPSFPASRPLGASAPTLGAFSLPPSRRFGASAPTFGTSPFPQNQPFGLAASKHSAFQPVVATNTPFAWLQAVDTRNPATPIPAGEIEIGDAPAVGSSTHSFGVASHPPPQKSVGLATSKHNTNTWGLRS